MTVLLHEGHSHSETASTALGPELMVLVTLSLLLLGVVSVSAVLRYARD